MRHTVYKFFSIGAYEKEEKWLNEMSAKGMQLVDASGIRYVFEEGEPGRYNYRLELLEHLPASAEGIAYLKFLEELGAEHIGSYLRWIYLRKEASEGPFEIYSDVDSKIKHLKRIRTIANVLSIFWIIFVGGCFFHAAESNQNVGLNILWGSMAIVLGIWIQFLVYPTRKSQRRLKKESAIKE